MARALGVDYRKVLTFALGFFLSDLYGQAASFAFSMAIWCSDSVMSRFKVASCW
jgi:hypothetical protein